MSEQDNGERPADEPEDSGSDPTAPIAPLLPRRIHRAWWILLAGTGIVALINFGDANIAENLFQPPDDVSFADKGFALALVALLLLPFRPLVGNFIDRHGPLAPISAALIIGGGGYIFLVILGPSWLTYFLADLVGGVVAATASIALLTIVANLFTRYVGLAFAIAFTGVIFGTNPPHVLVELIFWRALDSGFSGYDTIRFLSVLPIAVISIVLGLAIVVAMRRWRLWDERGWSSDWMMVDAPTASNGDESATDEGRNGVRPRRSAAYLYIAGAALSGTVLSPVLFSVNSVQANLGGVTLAALFSLPILLAVGALSDRYNPKLVVLAMLAILAITAISSLTDLGTATNILAVGLLIILFNARTPAILALQRNYFGRKRFGLIHGIQASVSAFVYSMSGFFPGYLLDAFWGQHSVEFLIGSILPTVIAFILILLMRRQQPRSTATESPAAAV